MVPAGSGAGVFCRVRAGRSGGYYRLLGRDGRPADPRPPGGGPQRTCRRPVLPPPPPPPPLPPALPRGARLKNRQFMPTDRPVKHDPRRVGRPPRTPCGQDRPADRLTWPADRNARRTVRNTHVVQWRNSRTKNHTLFSSCLTLKPTTVPPPCSQSPAISPSFVRAPLFQPYPTWDADIPSLSSREAGHHGNKLRPEQIDCPIPSPVRGGPARYGADLTPAPAPAPAPWRLRLRL